MSERTDNQINLDNPNSLETTLSQNDELLAILAVKNNDDFIKAVKRIKEISSYSYSLKPIDKRFSTMNPEQKVETAKRLAQLYRIVYHKVNFKREYSNLPLEDREMITKQILRLYHFGEKSENLHKKLSESAKAFYWKKIEDIIAVNGAFIDRRMHAPVNQEAKKVIRWDAYGIIECPEEEHLSEIYCQFRKERNKQKTKRTKTLKYDLFTSPAWAYNFSQFQNFAEIETKFQDSLNNAQIPQHLLPKLNAYDLADIVYDTYGKKEYNSAKLFSGSKFEFIKQVGKMYKNEIMTAHKMLGIDERYTRSLIREMVNFGVSSNVTPLEFIATQEALDKFTETGIDCKGIKAGDVYPDDFYNILFEKHAYHEIIARDEFGNRITGPEYDVDHKDTVDDCGGLLVNGCDHPNIQAVNRWPRYRMVEKTTHQLFIHAKDSVRKFGEKEESYVSRIRMPDENIVIMFGVDKSLWISHDMSHFDYVIDQDNYFKQTYLPTIQQAENIGKVHYTAPKIFGQQSSESSKKKGKPADDYGNSRMMNRAIAEKRGKGRR